MTSTLVTAVATTGVHGVTHAIEPDHIAGISSLTAAQSASRLLALVEACFSLSHVALVVTWFAAAYFIIGRTDFPSVYDHLGTFGAGLTLDLLGATMAVIISGRPSGPTNTITTVPPKPPAPPLLATRVRRSH